MNTHESTVVHAAFALCVRTSENRWDEVRAGRSAICHTWRQLPMTCASERGSSFAIISRHRSFDSKFHAQGSAATSAMLVPASRSSSFFTAAVAIGAQQLKKKERNRRRGLC